MKEQSASQQIDSIIAANNGWKGDVLARLRTIITQTDPSIVEEVKWKAPSRPEGLPVWSRNGIVCMAEIWKDNIKLIFPKGVRIKDSNKLFNARLKSRTDRAVEFRENDGIDNTALQHLIIEAIKLD